MKTERLEKKLFINRANIVGAFSSFKTSVEFQSHKIHVFIVHTFPHISLGKNWVLNIYLSREMSREELRKAINWFSGCFSRQCRDRPMRLTCEKFTAPTLNTTPHAEASCDHMFPESARLYEMLAFSLFRIESWSRNIFLALLKHKHLHIATVFNVSDIASSIVNTAMMTSGSSERRRIRNRVCN